MYSALTEGSIARFAQGADGSCAVIINTNAGYGIIFYDKNGNSSTLEPLSDQNILPVAMAISPIGGFIALSYTDIGGARLNSAIAFISTTGGAAMGSTIAKNIINPEQIIGGLQFMGASILLAISDTRIFALDTVSANTLWELPLNNRITATAFTNDLFAIAYGEPLLNRPVARQAGAQSNQSNIESGTISIYNTKGEQVLSLHKETPKSISLGFNHIIIEDRHGFSIFNKDDPETTREIQIPGNIMFLEFLGSQNRVLSLSPHAAIILETERR
jgi:hypothetical protein